MGEPRYRVRQIFKWIYEKGPEDFSGMTNLPKALVDGLSGRFFLNSFQGVEKHLSADGTIKLVFKLNDNKYIESVIISSNKRSTICISTQVGCRFGCVFCASGMGGFQRDLTTAEMLDQIIYARFRLNQNLTNYVFMGMGEPLDNYDNLISTIKIMNHKDGLEIGARRITVSTCGIIPAIKKLKTINTQINLSISLHAATDRLRDKIMPINKTYSLNPLIDAVNDYAKASNRIITIEYILIKGLNDSIADANALTGISRALKAKVNIIPYSPVPGVNFSPPLKKAVEKFVNRLTESGANVTMRISKGKDIQAACGQLAGKRDEI
jgi:23S rRNA (adenine2503-C2)-methyltransferase